MLYSSNSPAVLHFYVPVFGKVAVLPVRLAPRLRFYFYLLVVVSVSILDVPLPSSAQSGGPADLPEVAERARVDQQLADVKAKSDALTEEMDKLTNLPINTYLKVIEGEGVAKSSLTIAK